jgi:hypothetical protein
MTRRRATTADRTRGGRTAAGAGAPPDGRRDGTAALPLSRTTARGARPGWPQLVAERAPLICMRKFRPWRSRLLRAAALGVATPSRNGFEPCACCDRSKIRGGARYARFARSTTSSGGGAAPAVHEARQPEAQRGEHHASQVRPATARAATRAAPRSLERGPILLSCERRVGHGEPRRFKPRQPATDATART